VGIVFGGVVCILRLWLRLFVRFEMVLVRSVLMVVGLGLCASFLLSCVSSSMFFMSCSM